MFALFFWTITAGGMSPPGEKVLVARPIFVITTAKTDLKADDVLNGTGSYRTYGTCED
jgi:predicted homoserine dehydrogenase-like protein